MNKVSVIVLKAIFIVSLFSCSITGYDGVPGKEVKRRLGNVLIPIALAGENSNTGLLSVSMFLDTIDQSAYYREDSIRNCEERMSHLLLSVLDHNFSLRIDCKLKTKGYLK
ncbi:TIGR04452 family lipoprotein [Leptospira sp. WS92.C1]